MKILALDPALVSTGYVLYDKEAKEIEMIDSIKTELDAVDKSLPSYKQRMKQTNILVTELLWLFPAADIVVAEVPSGSKSASALAGMQRAEAAIQASCITAGTIRGYPLGYQPVPQSSVKVAVFGQATGVRKKDVVQKMIHIFGDFRTLMGNSDKRSIEDCADALAVLYFHLNYKLKLK